MSGSQLYSKILQEYLESHKNEWITSSLNEVYFNELSGLDHVTRALQDLSLAKDERQSSDVI
jgi:hypothetical protein